MCGLPLNVTILKLNFCHFNPFSQLSEFKTLSHGAEFLCAFSRGNSILFVLRIAIELQIKFKNFHYRVNGHGGVMGWKIV